MWLFKLRYTLVHLKFKLNGKKQFRFSFRQFYDVVTRHYCMSPEFLSIFMRSTKKGAKLSHFRIWKKRVFVLILFVYRSSFIVNGIQYFINFDLNFIFKNSCSICDIGYNAAKRNIAIYSFACVRRSMYGFYPFVNSTSYAHDSNESVGYGNTRCYEHSKSERIAE